MSYQAVAGGVLVAGLGFAAYLALSKDDSNMNDAPSYGFTPDGIDGAIDRMNEAINNYFINTTVPVDKTVTVTDAEGIAAVSEQQDRIYTPDAEMPVWQSYGTVNDSLKGWQADVASLLPAVVAIDYIAEGDKTGSIGNNAYNAYMNSLNAQKAEGLINWVKWADYEESTQQGDTLDLSQMEQMAAWLYVNDRTDYNSFVEAWKTMGGVYNPGKSSGAMQQDATMQTGFYSQTNIAWSDQEEQNIQNYVKQLGSTPKIAQYGKFASTPAPYTTDTQGNAVNVYTGVIMVGDQGPTGGKY